jgi:eukaryotic-like serine/threonine-protein kinase
MVRKTRMVSIVVGKRFAYLCFALLALAGICFSQTLNSRADWTQFLRNNMHRFNPYEKVLGVKNVGQLVVNWTYATGGSIEFSSPAVANGALYVLSDDQNLYAIDARSGGTLWSAPSGVSSQGSIAVADGIVYFAASKGVHALDAKTGVALWSFSVALGCGSPSTLHGTVYIGCFDGWAYALDGHTGRELWGYNMGEHFSPSPPAAVSGVVYFNSKSNTVNGTLYALNANNGKLIWSFPEDPYSGMSSPAVANGLVYIPPDNGTLYALNARNGTLVWSYSGLGNLGSTSAPAVAKGFVYVASYYGYTYAFNAHTGALLWKYNDGYPSPAVANGVLYLGCSLGLCALDAHTGALLWSHVIHRGAFSPVVVNGMVYVGSLDRNIYAFGLK